jgi:acetolactate synthase-1/3 small subunit
LKTCPACSPASRRFSAALNININSLTVGRSERPGLSRLTWSAMPPPKPATAFAPACLNLKMWSMWTTLPAPRRHSRAGSHQGRRHARNRSQIFDLVEVFRARIVDLTSESLMIEMTGVESKIEGLIEVLREDDGRILEICRSGKLTMRRGHHTSRVLKAMGAGPIFRSRDRSAESFEDSVAVEPE